MKNRERFKDELIEAIDNNLLQEFMIEHNVCGSWVTHITGRIFALMLWLDEEYKEDSEVDWSKVEVDTPILVSTNEENWNHRHFAEYRDGTVYAFKDGATSWTINLKTEWPYVKLAEPQE